MYMRSDIYFKGCIAIWLKRHLGAVDKDGSFAHGAVEIDEPTAFAFYRE